MLYNICKSKDWILGQQIGVIAVRLANYEPKRISDDNHLKFRNQMGQLLVTKLQEFDDRYHRRWSLSVSTLNLLQQLSNGLAFKLLPKRQKEEIKSWSTVYDQVNSDRSDSGKFRPSQINAANLISHQILYSDSSATSVARAAGDFLGRKLDVVVNQHNDVASLQQSFRDLRRPGASTVNLVKHIERLTKIFAKYSSTAYLIRNALFDHTLAWPLMVLGSSANVGPSGISLPIGVDLVLDGKNKTRCSPAEDINPELRFDFENWRSSLERSSDIGKKLWRSKNGNTGQLRQIINDASVCFDFSLADQIMSGIPNWSLSASDRSMEAYFAQTVLSKAIGNHCGSAAAVTGLIGEQRLMDVQKPDPNIPLEDIPLPEDFDEENFARESNAAESMVTEQTEVLDWEFELPDGLDDKGIYVARSKKYNRFVVPIPPKGVLAKLRKLGIETNHCRYLSSVADCVQVGGWRQHRYIRCPNISHVVHVNKSELRPYRTGSVMRTLGILKTNESPILHLDGDLDTHSLLSALHHLNFYRRLASEQIPPSISWTIIRRVPEEQDLRFWSLLFKSLGISNEQFNRFRNAGSLHACAKIISEIFYITKSGHKRLRQSIPDLVIILNHEREYTPSDDEFYSDHFHRHDIDLVLNELNKLGLPGHDEEKIASFLSNTRIIAVSNDSKLGSYSSSLSDLSDDELNAIARLRQFRFGFNQQMASFILGDLLDSIEETRTFLRALTRKKILTYGGGQYCLRRLAEKDTNLLPQHGQARLMLTHFHAALSFAPYLSDKFGTGQNIDSALSLENVREAIFHFECCSEHANNHLYSNRNDVKSKNIFLQSRYHQQKLKRYFDTATWGLVNSLCKKRSGMPTLETYQLAKELLTNTEENQQLIQPHAYATVARAAQRHFEKLATDGSKSSGQSKDDVELFRHETKEHFHKAEELARGHNRFKNELTFQVATQFSCFLHEHGLGEEEESKRKTLDKEADRHINLGTSSTFVDVKWFHIAGDNHISHLDALKYYQFGFSSAPNFYDNIVKIFGCEILLENYSNAERIIREFDAETLSRFCSFARLGRSKKHVDPMRRSHVLERYYAGAQFAHEFRISKEAETL